jgi:hypothetical protein
MLNERVTHFHNPYLLGKGPSTSQTWVRRGLPGHPSWLVFWERRRVLLWRRMLWAKVDVGVSSETEEPGQLWYLPPVRIQPTVFTTLVIGPLHFLLRQDTYNKLTGNSENMNISQSQELRLKEIPKRSKRFNFFFFFLPYWGLNSVPCA